MQVSIFTHSKVMAIWNGEKNVLVNVPVWQLFYHVNPGGAVPVYRRESPALAAVRFLSIDRRRYAHSTRSLRG